MACINEQLLENIQLKQSKNTWQLTKELKDKIMKGSVTYLKSTSNYRFMNLISKQSSYTKKNVCYYEQTN